jgi:hypothetical protein
MPPVASCAHARNSCPTLTRPAPAPPRPRHGSRDPGCGSRGTPGRPPRGSAAGAGSPPRRGRRWDRRPRVEWRSAPPPSAPPDGKRGGGARPRHACARRRASAQPRCAAGLLCRMLETQGEGRAHAARMIARFGDAHAPREPLRSFRARAQIQRVTSPRAPHPDRARAHAPPHDAGRRAGPRRGRGGCADGRAAQRLRPGARGRDHAAGPRHPPPRRRAAGSPSGATSISGVRASESGAAFISRRGSTA